MAEISIPVTLQIKNLQQLVETLQNQLSNLKVGTAGFKSVQSVIKSIRDEIDRLSVQTSRPFMDEKQFTKAENSVEKLESEIGKMEISLSRIKFSDLELTSAQKNDLKAFEDQITSIKDQLKTVKDTAKQAFLGSELGKDWVDKFDSNAVTKSLAQITHGIESELDKQTKKLNETKEAFNNYQNAIKGRDAIEQFLRNQGNPLDESNIGQKAFDTFFKLNSKNELQFQNGGRSLLAGYLQEKLTLSDAEVASITKEGIGGAQKIANTIRDNLNKILQDRESKVKAGEGTQANLIDQQAIVEKLTSTLQAAGASEASITSITAALRNELASASNGMKQYEQAAVDAARGNEQVQSTCSAMKSQLESFRGTLNQTHSSFLQLQRTQQSFNQMKMAVVNFMGFNQVLNLTKNAVKNAINHIKELDTVMNGISIVTNMSTSDLWDQVDAYSKMAQTFGVSIKGAYEVSQIYYQQGLQTKDVLTLTNETLKLAKISGLDYATTTDYMTTAIRGFKMEMEDAARVVDVYSALAAHTAVSQEELAVAMSKTASSMEGVGATFEEASAMIGTMVAVTRESATNIGSAMKSIASRYGELTKDPAKLIDADGEVMAFNKVDAALQSVGISMKTTEGQFREFTDVIIELGEKWNELDSTQQRYIATQFAGNRQQSRFLALVSNIDLLKSNLETANNSEDTGTLQALKALDSIEAKTEQVRVAYQQFYTTIGTENVWKGFLDGAKNVINTLNSLPKLFGKIPIGAIAAISSIISLVKSLGMDLLNTFAQTFGQSMLQGALSAQSQAQEGAQSLIGIVLNTIKSKKGEFTAAGKESAEAYTQGMQQNNTPITPDQLTGQNRITYNNNQNIIDTFRAKTAQFNVTGSDLNSAYAILANQMRGLPVDILEKINADETLAKQLLEDFIASLEKENQKLLETGNAAEQSSGKLKNFIANHKNLGQGLQSFGSALNMVAMTINTTAEGGKTWSGVLQGMAAAATLAGVAVKVLDTGLKSMPWMALVSGVLMAINAISTLIVTPEERLEELNQKAEELSNQAKQAKAEYRTLDNSIQKIEELKEKRYESTEAAEEYQTAVDELAEKFPAMIAGFDEAGNVILDTTDAERLLAEAREKSKQATYEAAQAELDKAKESRNQAQKNLAGESIANIKAYNYETQQAKSIQQLLQNWLGLSEADAGEIAVQPGLENKYDFLRRYEHIGSGQFINDYSTLDEARKYLEDNYNILTQNQKEFYNLFFGAMDTPEQLITEYTELQSEINTLLENPTEDNRKIIQQKFTQLKSIYDQAFVKYSNNDLFNFDDAAKSIETIGKEIDTWNNSVNITKGYEKQVISAWQQSGQANQDAWEILSKSGEAASLVTKVIFESLNGADWNYEEATDAEKVEWLGYQQTVADFIQSLTTDELSKFESMMNDSANFTTEDFTDAFGTRALNITEFLQTWFADSIESINARLDEDLLKSSGQTDISKLTGFYDELQSTREQLGDNITTTEENYFHTIIAEYKSLMDQGYTKTATSFGESALTLFTEINSLNGNLEKIIWETISNNGLKTIEGINASIESIKNNEGLEQGQKDSLTGILELIKSTIIPNINLSIQTQTQNLLDTWSDASKNLTKAMEKKLTLKEANELIQEANSLGIDIDVADFTATKDKMVLSAEKFSEYWIKLQEANRTNADEFQTAINQASDYLDLTRNIKVELLSGSQFEDIKATFESIGITWQDNFIGYDGRLTEEAYSIIQKAIQDAQNGLKNFVWYNETAAKQVAQAYDWSEGNYFGTDKIGEDGKQIYDSIVKTPEELIQLIKTDIQTHFSSKDNIQEREMLDNVYESYNALISDVLSKGFNNIHLEDYTGLIQGYPLSLENTSYTDFIKSYSFLAGKSVDEVNNLLVQAMKKDREQISESLIKDFTFTDTDTFIATYESLGQLANAFDKDLATMLNAAALMFNNATGEYTVSVEQLKTFGIDLTQIENFRTIVQKSIDGLFDSITSDVSKAVSGKLDISGAVNLRNNLLMAGIELNDNSLIQTNEGIKLTEDAFFNLYGNLSTIDKRIAKKLIPDMTKLSTRYSNLQSVLKEYENAQQNSIKRLAMRELASSMLRDPKSYNLLGSEMPQTWQIANSFYGNIPKAKQITNKMANTGSVSAEDFSSLMQSIMQSSNKDDAQQALEWMQMAPDFFYETADGTLMINTAKMGIKNLKELNRMWEDAFEEVRQLGDNEQKVYNELYYGSESLERADVWKDDGGLDASKLKEIIDSKTQQGNNIKALLDKYKLGNKTLYDSLSETTDTELRDRIIKKLSTIDWNYDDFESQIAESLEELGLGGKIRFDSNGNYEVIIDQDSSKIDILYEAEGKTLTKNSYSKWIAAKAKAEMQGDGNVTTEDTIEGTENSIHYRIENQEITVTLDANGNILYKCTINGQEIAATNESDLRAAIIALAGKGDGDENVEAPEAARTITINGKQYTIVVDAEGKVQLQLEPGTYEILEDGSAEQKVVNELQKEQDKQAQAAAEQIEPTTVEGGDVTITPSAVNIIVDESTPVTIGALTKDKVDVNATNVDVTSTNPPTTDNLNIDNIPYDKQTNVKLSNIITENTSEPDNSKVIISPFTYSDDVQVTLNKINALYTGKPNIDNVKLSDTGLTYSQQLGLVLLNVLLKSEAGKTVFRQGTITLNNNTQLQIADVVNGLLTGMIRLNSDANGVTVAAGSYVTLKDGSKVDLPEGTIVNGELGESSKIKLTGKGVDAETGAITLKDGTAVTIDEVIGEVMKVIAQWAAGAKKTPDFKNDLNLPTTYDAPPGIITQELQIKYELTDDQKRKLEESYQRIDQQLAGYSINPSKTGSFDKWALGGKNGKDWKVNLNELGAYVQVLKDLASAGQILSEVELHNLQGLTDYDNLPENISEMAQAAINLSNSNSSNLSGAIDNLKQLDTISGENLTLVVNSLEALASAATLLQSINWSTIAQGINSLNNPAHPVEAENLGGKEGLTANVTLILQTKGALAAFNELKQKLVLPKVLVQGNTNPLYNAVKNLKLPDKVVKVVYDESNKPAGATGNVFTEKGSNGSRLNYTKAAGNVALAGGRGTLMGELGPELYVTNGHYYIAGQSGAEFVDLPEDAIVFNHLQTARLLNNGKTGHGKAVVNERKAVGEAHARASAKIDADTKDHAVLDAQTAVIQVDRATLQTDLTAKENQIQNTYLNNYIKALGPFKDIIAAYNKNGVIAVSEYQKLQTLLKGKLQDKIPEGATYHTKELMTQAYSKVAEQAKIVIKAIDDAAAAQRAAAQAASDAAKAQEDAANQQQQEDKEPTKSQNEYATVQTPRGIVHPGAAPKLKDVFLGNAPSTPTSTSGSSGGRSSAGTPRGTGSSLGKSTAEMSKLYRSSSSSSSADVQKKVKEAKSAVSNFLSDLLERGIESIDLSKYENLPAELKTEIQGKIDNNTSYRDFVVAYAGALDQSMSEINSTYFQAWQKDLETVGMAEEQMEALEGLSMYLDGTIGGQADDWVTLLGDKAFVGDAVEAGVLQWDADLRQYVATSQQAVMDFMNTDLGMVWNFPEVLVDNTQAVIDEINELMEKAISGEGLTSKEKSRLEALLKKSNYTGTAEFNQNANGKFGITNASAKEIADSLKGNTEDTVLDSIIETRANVISSLVKSASKEGISNSDYAQLVAKFKDAYGTDLNIDFTKTDSGYSATIAQIMQQYETIKNKSASDAKQFLKLIGDSIDISEMTEAEIKSYQDAINEAMKQGNLTLAEGSALMGPITDAIRERTRNFIDSVTKGIQGIATSKDIDNIRNELRDKFNLSDEELQNITFEDDGQNGIKLTKDSVGWLMTHYPQYMNEWVKAYNQEITDTLKEQETKTRGMYDIWRSNVSWDAYYETFSASEDTLAQIFATQNTAMTEEWLKSLERTYDGQYKFSMKDIESQGIVFDASLFPEYERYLQEQAKAREEQIANGIGNMISTFIDQGFSAIDFRDYYDLPSEIIDDIKASSKMSKRDFVAKFAQAAGKTVSEMNQLYFEAWEKDIGLSVTEAAKNMQYYKNGGMSGSSSDWTAMLGDAVKVSDLVRNGLLEYNEVLGTYYTNNFAEIQKIAGLDIDSSVINDSIREAFKNIADTLEQGLNGALSGMDAKAFKERLNYMGLGNVQLDFTETAEGLQLSQQSAISLYTELKKIDGLQAQLVFNKLKDSLEQSNDKYKTMTSILKNIKELQDAINNAENYSDEKIRQYREELALAKEIAAVRATSEDDSFNFLDQDIPAAMKNPFNYVNSWINGWKELREAEKDQSAMDFTHMYNMLQQVNDLAALTGETLDFLGITLDGTAEAINKGTDVLISALGSDNSGSYGVLLNKLGEDFKSGVDNYAQSADTAIHAMARSQMEIIGALIKVFETIVALEEFDGADIDLNGILSLDEIFSDAQELGDKAIRFTEGYQNVAKSLADKMAVDGELAQAFESVKINGISIAEIIRDAADDGIKNIALSADEYQAAINALHNLVKTGDFDPDNIAASLHEELMKVGKDFHGTIEYDDFVIDLSYNVTIQKKDGKYITSSGAEYDNYGEALAAEALENTGIKNQNITTYLNESTGKYEASGTLTIANMEIEVVAADGAVHYNVNGTECATLAEAQKAVWEHQKANGETDLEYPEWRIDQGIVVYGTITDVKLEPMSKQQVEAAVGVTYEQIQDELKEADSRDKLLKLSAKYGIDFTKVENFDEKDWENFKTLIGVESKNVEVTASISANSSNPGLLELIEEGKKAVDIVATTENAEKQLEDLIEAINQSSGKVSVGANTNNAEQALINIQTALKNLSEVGTIKIKAEFEDVGSSMAKGAGIALAGGTKTLMGELGPELYVANGHYYIAGQGGAEFVNLPKDAIVFNHLQTKQLMGSGISGRGKPITNERNAVAMATGALGPAMANAKTILATLKQLYAMWSNLANSSILDLAGLGGTGGGGANNIDSWIRKVEKWYNLLQEIAALEKEINYEEALRNKIVSDINPNFKEFHESQKRELEYWKSQAQTKQELADSYKQEYEQQRAYYNSNNSPFSKLYSYDERGQIKYKDGTLEALSKLFAQDASGKPQKSAVEQFNEIRTLLGKNAEGRYIADIYSQYDAGGQKVERGQEESNEEFASKRLQALFSHIDAEQEEMQSLYDSAHDMTIEALEAQTELNKQRTEWFNNLKTALEESNDNYKTMGNLLSHIADLRQKINDSEKYSDEKIKQYKEELALAEAIAAARATSEDESMNFLDEEIPGAMNNPLNYINNWIEGFNELREAANENKAIDFKHYYNIVKQINQAAGMMGTSIQFAGVTLNGSVEAFHNAIMSATAALGSDTTGTFGVLASQLVGGAEGMSAGIDDAIHTMAESQIKMLDAMINLLETIVAMEEMGQVDIDKNGFLDFDEIFQDIDLEEKASRYTQQFVNAASILNERMLNNPEFKAAMDSVFIGNHSFSEIIQDATDGTKELTIDSQALAAALNTFFAAMQSNSFDLSNIYESLGPILANIEGFDGIISTKLADGGTLNFDCEVGIAITAKEGKYTIEGSDTVYDSYEDAKKAAVEQQLAKQEAAAQESTEGGTTETQVDMSVEAQVNVHSEQAKIDIEKLKQDIGAIVSTISVEADTNDLATAIQQAKDLLNTLPNKIAIGITTDNSAITSTTSTGAAQAKGNAMASGTKTLMGELGPELYVTNGHYYIAGRDGAEFVNLPKDAIVFNHLQTQKLLGSGNSSRGHAITTEANAVALATGAIGPAMATAKEALATLKQLRAMWQALADSSIQDLAGLGGANKGQPVGAWLADVERWYNLLQKIAQLEKEINYQEALRNKIQSDRIVDGQQYFALQEQSLNNLIQQANSHRELMESQQEFFDKRRKELNSQDSPLSQFYEYDENGQLKFKEGGYAALAEVVARDDKGRAKYTPKQQYDILSQYKGLTEFMKYDSNGQLITRDKSDTTGEQWYKDMVQALWEKMEAERTEMQELHDSIEQNKLDYINCLTKGNELLQQVIDNQIKVENNVLEAIESREQMIIDELSEQRDQMAKETNKYIDGLNKALTKERELYNKNQEDQELVKLERQLAILRRSGGSASQIHSLESELDSKRRDQYFDLQDEQINAVKEASDAQLARLDAQIELMTQTLEFEKAHGMLWQEVAQIMSGSSDSIIDFITRYDTDYAAKSTLDQQEVERQLELQVEQWTGYRDTLGSTIAEAVEKGIDAAAEARYDPIDPNKEMQFTPSMKAREIDAKSSSSSSTKTGQKTSSSTKSSTSSKYQYELSAGSSVAKPTNVTQVEKYTTSKASDTETLMQQIAAIDKEIANQQAGITWYQNHIKTALEQLATFKVAGVPTTDAGWIALEDEKAKSEDIIKQAQQMIQTLKARKVQYMKEIDRQKSYKNGGVVDYTGLAMVHGSKEEPEGILNSKDYKLWKQSIGSNVWESLERERLEMQALHDTFNSVITNSSDSSIVIEKAEVNVNVEQIANDYDAKRMGEQALQEMVRIARKTGTATIRR